MRRIYLGGFPILLLLVSCTQISKDFIDLDKERKAILRMHANQRSYHFEKDSITSASQFSDQFISANRGEIKEPTFEESKARYYRYFTAVDFVKWDDTREPIIRFSEDGKMAYTIVEKEVVVRYEYRGDEVEQTTNFAWVTIYIKEEDGWKIDCVGSTNKESVMEILSTGQ